MSRKIQDETEVWRWFREGRTYAYMIEQYREKYNIDTTVSLWANFRRRKGIPPRVEFYFDLIPWVIREEHRTAYPLAMLRVVGRQRRGEPLRPQDRARMEAWLAQLEERNLVVHYDPDTPDGFYLIPREDGDTDIVRKPVSI